MSEYSTPSFARRLGASIYEFTLLFGIYFVTGALIQVAFTLMGKTTPIWLLQVAIFIIMGCYFAHSWQKAGQTLAQRTWHIKIISTDKRLPSVKQVWLRYIFAYIGVLPALLMAFTLFHPLGEQSLLSQENISTFFVQTMLMLLINWGALLGTSWLNPRRRALHELVSGTCTIYCPNS